MSGPDQQPTAGAPETSGTQVSGRRAHVPGGWWVGVVGAWGGGRLMVRTSVMVSPSLAKLVPSAIPLGPDLRWRAWDALWYERMLTLGWGHIAPESYRFFPGYPLAAEPLSHIFGSLLALFAVTWLTALAGIALAGELTKRVTGDESLALRVMILTGLFPAAMALVLPYSEGLALTLVAATLLALLDQRWEWVAALSLLASVVRPTGVLLVVPVVIELWRAWPNGTSRSRAAMLSAVAAPVVGLAGVFAWVGIASGDWGLPLTVQRQIRGGFLDPVRAVAQLPGEILGGNLSDGVNLLFVVVLVVGAIGMWRLPMPTSLRAFGVVTLLVALSAHNIDSLGRYGMVTTPLIIGLCAWLDRRWAYAAAVSVSALGLAAMTLTSQWGLVVP